MILKNLTRPGGGDAIGATIFPFCREVTRVQAEATELLVRLLTAHQEDLFRYIFALLPHEEDARDVLQETSVALCRKFAEYDPTQPFLPWAFRFAYTEVLKQRQRNQRRTLLLSHELIERLAAEREQMGPVLQARLVALEVCLERLPHEYQQLLRRRYRDKARVEELVQDGGGSRRTLFRKLERIRRVLLECISQRTAGEAG
jgi:RNA polymerase sigma-70 factor (ECF subfamily)